MKKIKAFIVRESTEDGRGIGSLLGYGSGSEEDVRAYFGDSSFLELSPIEIVLVDKAAISEKQRLLAERKRLKARLADIDDEIDG